MNRIFFLLFLSTATAFAAEPRIEHLSATTTSDRIDVEFTLANAFIQPEIQKAIHSGIPTGFTYWIELVRKRPNWFDDRLATVKLEVFCTFNSVTKEYLVNTRKNKKLVRSETFNDFTALQERMTRVVEPELFSSRTAAHKLRVRVRADLIRQFIFYVVPRDVSTDWKETRVRRLDKK